jgi:hypothetical protein
MSDYTDHVIDDEEHIQPGQEDIGWFDPEEPVDEETGEHLIGDLSGEDA